MLAGQLYLSYITLSIFGVVQAGEKLIAGSRSGERRRESGTMRRGGTG